MPHDISPDEHYVADESVTWEYTIEEDGSAKDLSSGSVSWYLLPHKGADTGDAILDDSDSSVSASILSPASDGRVDVTIDADATGDEAGETHWQRLVVEVGGDKQIWRGSFPIQEP